MTLVGGTPSGAEAAENIRHLQLRTRHAGRSVRLCLSITNEFERALDLSDGIDRHPGVARGRVDLAMAEQVLDHAHVHALLQQVRREAVPQGMWADGLVETGMRQQLRAMPAARNAP